MPIGTATYVVCTDDGSIPPSVMAGLAHLVDQYGRWYGSSSDAGGGREVAAAIERGGGGGGMVVGTPEQVLDQLAPLAAAFPDREHELCVRLHYPGMPRAEVEDHVARFAEGVLPALRS
jgi:alkanesulfonate monooxygenase SsuD/methylene tetrahydromethanopterin reductase-like flavin-dependent oxidoreductase (luciferase family)